MSYDKTFSTVDRYKAMCLRFKRVPNKEYLNQFYKVMRQEAKGEELDILIHAIPLEFSSFPSIEEGSKLLKKIRYNSERQKQIKLNPKPIIEPRAKVQGTPARWEAVFIWIDKGETETPWFKRAVKGLGVSDEDLWACYETWKGGGLNPLVNEWSKKYEQIGINSKTFSSNGKSPSRG
jgi:hypothetical protein